MPTQKILYVDIDDMLCNYMSAFQIIKTQQPEVEFPQSVPGFFKKSKTNGRCYQFLFRSS